MKKSLTNKTLNGFLWLITGKGTQFILQIFILAILARLIAPKEFGLAQPALVVIGFAKLFSQMGVGPAIVQRRELTNDHIRVGFSFSLFMGLLFSALVFFLSGGIASFFNMPELQPILKVISFIFLIECFVIVSQSLLQRKMKFKAYASANILSYLVGYGIVAIILGYLGYGVWALIWGVLAQTVVKAIIVSIIEPHSCIPVFKRKAFNDLVYYGGGITIGKFAGYLASQGDNIVVGRYLGAEALGVYSRAYNIMVTPVSLFGEALNKTLFPAMSSVNDNVDKLKTVYLKGVSVSAFVSLPSAVFIAILAPEIVRIILGPNWDSAILPLQLLALGLFFRMGYKISDSITLAIGVVYSRAMINIVFALSVLVFGYFGTNWGTEGVAAAIVLALGMHYIIMAYLSLKNISVGWTTFLMCHLRGFAVSIIFGLILFSLATISRNFGLSAFITLLVTTIVSGILGVLIMYIYPKIFLDQNVFDLMKTILKTMTLHKFSNHR